MAIKIILDDEKNESCYIKKLKTCIEIRTLEDESLYLPFEKIEIFCAELLKMKK